MTKMMQKPSAKLQRMMRQGPDKLKRGRLTTNRTPVPSEGAYAIALREVAEYQRRPETQQRRDALMAGPPARTIQL